MNVNRQSLLKDLVAHRHNGLVKIITGIRRCGKSYLLSVLFKKFLLESGVDAKHIIEVPLDRDEFSNIRDAIRLGEYVRSKIVHDGKWNYVFIDEVQLTRRVLPDGVDLSRVAPEDRDGAYVSFFDTLNGLRQMEHVDVYVTGSNSKMLSSDIETNFADRGYQVRVHPFSFAEYCEATHPTDKQQAFDDYLVWGGMPLSVAETNPNERAKYLKRLVSETYLRDIVKRHNLRGDRVMAALVDILSSATGSLTNPHKLVNTMQSVLKVKTNDHAVAQYLDYLEDAFVFSKAKRWDVKGNHYFDYPVKYYSEDVGIRNAQLDFREADPSHAMENVIYNELVRRGCMVDVGVVPIVAMNSEGKRELRYHEIDFVVNKPPKKLYIQSAFRLPSQEKESQELLPLRRSGDFFRKMVIVGGTQHLRISSEGLLFVGVVPFLLDETILAKAMGE